MQSIQRALRGILVLLTVLWLTIETGVFSPHFVSAARKSRLRGPRAWCAG